VRYLIGVVNAKMADKAAPRMVVEAGSGA